MATLNEIALLQVKLHELTRLVDDILAQERAVPSHTPTPPSSPKPTRVLPSPQSLPLLTPVHPRSRSADDSACNTADAPAPEQSFNGVQADVASVGSGRGVSSAILKCENITFRKAAGSAAQSTVSPRRRLAFMSGCWSPAQA